MNIQTIEKRIIEVFGNHPITDERINIVEEKLNVRFPEIFLRLNKLCSYEYSSFVGFFYFGDDDSYSVVDETLGVRKYYEGNANFFVVLYSDDAGIFLLNTADENASVMWCSIYDVENFLNGQPLTMSHDFFPTFADFFSYLLDEEEKERAEDQ